MLPRAVARKCFVRNELGQTELLKTKNHAHMRVVGNTPPLSATPANTAGLVCSHLKHHLARKNARHGRVHDT